MTFTIFSSLTKQRYFFRERTLEEVEINGDSRKGVFCRSIMLFLESC